MFPEKFLFCTDMIGSIAWPSPASRLHIDDCFEIHNENFVICCNQITKIFCTRYGFANTFFARSPFDFLSSGRSRNFGLSGSEYEHSVYPNPHFSQALAQKIIHEKNWRVSLCLQELCHPQDFLCSHSSMLEFNKSHRSRSGSSFLFGLGFLVDLVNNSSEVSEGVRVSPFLPFHMFT